MRQALNSAHTDFARDGIAFLRGAVEQTWIDLLAAGIDRAIEQPSPYKRVRCAGGPDEFIDDECSYFTTPEYKIFLHESPLIDLVAEVLNTQDLWLFFDQTFAKAGASGPTNWHQDTPYFCAAGSQFASVWVNVDPVPLEASLRMVSGSHLGPLREAQDTDPAVQRQEQSSLPDQWPNVDEHADDFDVVSYPIEPGDVVLFHPSILHGGAPTIGGRRRTVSFRLFGEDVVFQRAPAGKMVPRLPGVLGSGLMPGDPLRGPWFPKLLPRQGKAYL
jgi:ectoine hydroxylase-related dioxygenase (phytanoyl-CoA dioxygenase family)